MFISTPGRQEKGIPRVLPPLGLDSDSSDDEIGKFTYLPTKDYYNYTHRVCMNCVDNNNVFLCYEYLMIEANCCSATYSFIFLSYKMDIEIKRVGN